MINLEKYGFKKTEKNIWAGYKDYIKDHVNPEYGYYLHVTVHDPCFKGDSKDITYKFHKIIVHRWYNPETIEQSLEDGESMMVYYGLIESEKWFEELLVNLGINEISR